ncbi:protein of unknown function DUF1659 [Desulfitobacterium hafniense DCB-2]|uniref:DUF1659 domain-containing protein n=1 Tax=Desulfitobacterium hafniense (strain DSM 10664 / DCB-2) TaxID=272564 RepID=B8G2J0_DESHD|nr:DUF1659 domain-containing protein [Desulfitobacterium hafniense]ACL21340.1 protein of unknown function DUF1659 [Desulfitobacterium hafniense DCB-2]
MTVISTPLVTEMILRYQTGMVNGSPVIRQKSISWLKTDTADEDIYEVAVALFELLDYPLISVTRNNRFELIEE